ncbi:hypothetical protein [Hyphobacterium sp.]|uniref:hypothetical protein n=1 Tax=Hyphobacterium sp. TaxID=2004662 RepID=UPI003BAD67D0
MSGFGKRGVTQPARGPARPKPVARRTQDTLRERPPPRVQTGSSLHWTPILPLTAGYAQEVPDDPGVYMLLSAKREVDVVYIAGVKDLRAEFLSEVERHGQLDHPQARYFSCATTPAPFEQAESERRVFKRRFGFVPRLNSGF